MHAVCIILDFHLNAVCGVLEVSMWTDCVCVFVA